MILNLGARHAVPVIATLLIVVSACCTSVLADDYRPVAAVPQHHQKIRQALGSYPVPATYPVSTTATSSSSSSHDCPVSITTTTTTTTTATTTTTTATCPPGSVIATPGASPSPQFCQNPPTVPDLNLTLYASGTYFSIFQSGSANTVSGNRCVTANYTLLPNGTVNVLNCDALGPGKIKPFCVRGFAVKRPNATEDSQLQVSFPSVPFAGSPGAYNVAAVLGSPTTGYAAAAVYSCGTLSPSTPPSPPGFFIISRSPNNADDVLRQLKDKLRCSGYDVSVDFLPVDQSNCLYFFDPTGFNVGALPF